MSKNATVGGGTRALQESEAVPASAIHADPQPPQYNWADYTINGLPIPEDLWPNMRYSLTDQAIAEARAKRGPAPVTRVTRDQDDKRLDIYRDGLATGNLVMGTDPLDHMAKKHVPPGYRHVWMGKKKVDEAGLVRGVVEYKPLMIDDPDNPGQKKRVTQNGMFLAVVPESIAREAEAYYASIGRSKAESTVEKMREHADKIMVDGGLDELARKRRRAEDLMGIQVDDSEGADAELLSSGAIELPHESE